ncbi:helix-turn-helix domain-containing protein [Sphingobium boeckii]|uniref:Y4mF family transcriptional regulator n=1 Tax=Sphingobium boeckii TaxID=1082345 RepID=A0A7W9AH96_9SPHN|nr:helix-turn-helix domain-containing protein [Sphingobium boeckii]MBB5685672.1 y4mF family transcriptional regulator [Sphingobium boeckii]
MSFLKETDAARLLREMRERDGVFKMLDSIGSLKRLRSPLGEIQSAGDSVMQPLLQDRIRTFQDAPTQRAIDLARQLTRPASPAAGTKTETKLSPTQAPIRTVSDLGAMIRKARKAMKLNQAEFAAHAGVGRRFISELESGGKGSLEFDKVLACALAAGIDITARSRSA